MKDEHIFKFDDGDNGDENNTCSFSFFETERRGAIEIMMDSNLRWHSVVKLNTTQSKGKSTKGKSYIKPRKCVGCGALSRVKCLECDEVYCYPIKKQYDPSNSCFCEHVKQSTSPLQRLVMRSRKK